MLEGIGGDAGRAYRYLLAVVDAASSDVAAELETSMPTSACPEGGRRAARDSTIRKFWLVSRGCGQQVRGGSACSELRPEPAVNRRHEIRLPTREPV